MNIDIIRIQKKGLITLPKKIRESAGFEENGYARITKQGQQIILEPLKLSYPIRQYTDSEIDEFLESDKRETTQLKKKKLV